MKKVMSYKRELSGVFVLMIAMFLTLSCLTYHVKDPSFIHTTTESAPIANMCGLIGAYVASMCFYLLGGSVCIFLGSIFFVAYILFFNISFMQHVDRFCALFLLMNITAALCALLGIHIVPGVMPGGVMGTVMAARMVSMVEVAGSLVILGACFWACIVIIARSSIIMSFVAAVHYARVHYNVLKKWAPAIRGNGRMHALGNFFARIAHVIKTLPHTVIYAGEKEILTQQEQTESQEVTHVLQHDDFWEPYAQSDQSEPQKDQEVSEIATASDSNSARNADYLMPSKSLFNIPMPEDVIKNHASELSARARVLEEKLAHFGVQGSVVSIQAGPVVTLFEYQPQIDSKVSKIVALENDLALALQAMSIRILAPIPGRSVVGFEVANRQRKKVNFARLLTGEEFAQYQGVLPVIVGEDTVGKLYCVDLVALPHLLIAGSTGSGKSVALNGLLMSLLYKVKPDECKLILIDPKRLEFAAYNDIPHLLVPPVTQASQAALVLRWLVYEMEERYKLLAEAGVRNIFDYQRIKKGAMPFIVVVIDELADLMMSAGKEIEILIVRLAQMARAAGIHLVVATQRPSVDVITGLIKVNFPSRIALRVTSATDSRTILDCGGAEKLVGKGDMLVLESQSAFLKRAHGAYVADEDIEVLTSYLREQQAPCYLSMDDLMVEKKETQNERDELLGDVIRFVQEMDEISISLLQRKFRIGYNRSARLIDELEAQGMIMPAHGGKMRKVVRS